MSLQRLLLTKRFQDVWLYIIRYNTICENYDDMIECRVDYMAAILKEKLRSFLKSQVVCSSLSRSNKLRYSSQILVCETDEWNIGLTESTTANHGELGVDPPTLLIV